MTLRQRQKPRKGEGEGKSLGAVESGNHPVSHAQIKSPFEANVNAFNT